MRVSLRDIAAHLQLHNTTVSRALRHDPRISPETTKKVLAACKELGYRPNSIISDLAALRWKTNRVPNGTVIAYINRARPGDFLGKAFELPLQEKAEMLGYRLQTFRRYEFESSAKLQRALRNRGITDVILGPSLEGALKVELDWEKFICIQLLATLFPLPLHTVVLDHFNSVILAWQKVVDKGYRRIGITLFDHRPTRLLDDITRLSAVHACQTYLFPHLPRLPALQFRDDSPPEEFFAWIERHQPEVIIGFTGYHYEMIRTKFGRSTPYVCLYGDSAGKLACTLGAIEICAQEAINLLHFCRRTYQWGIPEQRIDHVIEPRWHEGTSLPDKQSSSPSLQEQHP
jgi:DNA-binding LacI/PurR family transcriptional regulator